MKLYENGTSFHKNSTFITGRNGMSARLFYGTQLRGLRQFRCICGTDACRRELRVFTDGERRRRETAQERRYGCVREIAGGVYLYGTLTSAGRDPGWKGTRARIVELLRLPVGMSRHIPAEANPKDTARTFLITSLTK